MKLKHVTLHQGVSLMRLLTAVVTIAVIVVVPRVIIATISSVALITVAIIPIALIPVVPVTLVPILIGTCNHIQFKLDTFHHIVNQMISILMSVDGQAPSALQ